MIIDILKAVGLTLGILYGLSGVLSILYMTVEAVRLVIHQFLHDPSAWYNQNKASEQWDQYYSEVIAKDTVFQTISYPWYLLFSLFPDEEEKKDKEE